MLNYLSYSSNTKIVGSKIYKELFDKNKALCNKIYKDNIVWFHKKMEFEKIWQEKHKLLKIYNDANFNSPVEVEKKYTMKYGSVLLHSTGSVVGFISITSIMAFFGFIFYSTK